MSCRDESDKSVILIREDYEKALAAITEESWDLNNYSWIYRLKTWADVIEMGEKVADGLHDAAESTRAIAPELFDWMIENFPESDERKVRRERYRSSDH